ncbi:hypothetical protein E3E11_04340 [Oecophyllibacter saccharovorans]|uniref:hypothetical protein n=1 Tax=Oecophyllibacter saccharovorans TaxID=2558360 RepID=UPI0011439053|nr:hypothetical protein [Oecophyllibacter saccharovorans]QDH15210.1 hypothetical protein E3E11_04340 [Oecophyllibacter saccharovorans]
MQDEISSFSQVLRVPADKSISFSSNAAGLKAEKTEVEKENQWEFQADRAQNIPRGTGNPVITSATTDKIPVGARTEQALKKRQFSAGLGRKRSAGLSNPRIQGPEQEALAGVERGRVG